MTDSIHHLRVELRHLKPAIRRELVVPSDLRLDRLHQVLQIVMGWEDEHLHEFIVGSMRDGEHFGPPEPGGGFDFGGPPKHAEKRYTVAQIAPRKGSKFLYWYDFGDDWLHAVTVTAIASPQPGQSCLECLDGARACPPEDCGGPPGYENLLTTLADPEDEAHEDARDWVGDGFDPERFDIEAVNRSLTTLATRWANSEARRKRRAAE